MIHDHGGSTIPMPSESVHARPCHLNRGPGEFELVLACGSSHRRDSDIRALEAAARAPSRRPMWLTPVGRSSYWPHVRAFRCGRVSLSHTERNGEALLRGAKNRVFTTTQPPWGRVGSVGVRGVLSWPPLVVGKGLVLCRVGERGDQVDLWGELNLIASS